MKKRTMAALFAVAFGLLLVLWLSAGAQEASDGTYGGYLFCKLENIGTKSEGPSYYLQQWDNSEVHIIKNGILWQNDPQLDEHLNTKVTITGTIQDGQLRYTKIEPFMYGAADKGNRRPRSPRPVGFSTGAATAAVPGLVDYHQAMVTYSRKPVTMSMETIVIQSLNSLSFIVLLLAFTV